jgi:hypothetical protein
MVKSTASRSAAATRESMSVAENIEIRYAGLGRGAAVPRGYEYAIDPR